MSILTRLFASSRSRAANPASRPPSQLQSMLTQQAATSSTTTRRELLRVVLRDTLNRHGIPSGWISAEILNATSRTGAQGLHWRLQLRHWDPRLLVHLVAIQQNLIQRVMAFDPLAAGWLSGVSWQFMLPDESVCPEMPAPQTWAALPDPAPGVVPVAAPITVHMASAPAAHAPVEEETDARADLERLFAIRDEDFRRHGSGDHGEDAQPTQPMWVATEPARL